MPTLEDTGLGAVSATKSQSNSRARTSYNVYTPKDRYQIGKYSSEIPAATVRKFNESTARGFQKKYIEKLRSIVRTGRSPEKEIGGDLRRGRPLLLGSEIDEKVRKFLLAIRYRGGQVSFSTAIAVATALIQRSNNEGLKLIEFGKDWVQSLFRRIGFKKRAATTGKFTIPVGQDYYKTMVFAEGDFVKWSIVVLKQFLSERNVPVPAGNRKTT